MMKTKICFKCHKRKPVSSYYKHPQMHDGFLKKCKACAKMDAIINRVVNLERVQAYDRNRKLEPDRLEQRRRNSKRQTRLYPHKRRAHGIVAKAIKKGWLIPQPCEVCKVAPADAHHDNYKKPLEVRWLCPFHHHAAHRKYDYDKILKQQNAKQSTTEHTPP